MKTFWEILAKKKRKENSYFSKASNSNLLREDITSTYHQQGIADYIKNPKNWSEKDSSGEKWAKDLGKSFMEEETWMMNNHTFKCSSLLVIRETKINITISFIL